MEQASKEVINLLTEFLICEIGSKAIDGITYDFVLKSDKDKTKFNRYNEIKNKINELGYRKDEMLRVYEISNGFIYDMDLSLAKIITVKLAKNVEQLNGISVGNGDLIGDSPEKRRKSDMVGLAKLIKSEFESGNKVIEVALFSRNTVPHIYITGKDSKNNVISIKYPAFAIRHWDIETINTNLLIPAGIRVSKLEPIEILPSRTGVLFKMHIENM